MQTISKKLEPYDPQNKEHNDPGKYKIHNGSVFDHIMACLEKSPYNDPVINLATLFHDCGKTTTLGFKNDGSPNYHGHESAGVPIVSRIFERLKFGELSAQDKKSILFAVEKHMLVHSLDKLNIKNLSRLILSPEWEICKAVGYCDEASRGSGLFDEKSFWEKIQRAEEKVFKLGKSAEDLRHKIKKYVDGNRLMSWYPEIKNNPKILKPILDELQEFIINLLDKGKEPTEQEIRKIVGKHL